MRLSRIFLFICAFLIVLSSSVGVTAQSGEIDALGSPELNAYAPNNDLTPGSEETLTVQIGNEGDFQRGSASDRQYVTTARDVAVSLNAGGTPIGVETGEQSIGELPESQTGTPEFDLTVPDSASPGTYTLTVNLDYSYTSKARDAPSLRAQTSENSRSVERTIRVTITDDARFEVTELDSNLRVGEEGEITGQLENVGRDDAANAEVSFAPESETVVALESNVAVGDIAAGESTQFSIPVEVTSDAEAVPKRFDLPVTFRDENGIRQSDDDPEFRVDVANQRDAFLIEPVDSSIEAGGSRALDIEVTNNLGEPVSDIEGKLFADDPLDSSNDETFTTELDPGETTTVTVDLSAASGATLKNYPASMDFRYTDADGDSKLTDSYRLAVSVTEPADDGGGSPIVPLLLGLLVVAGIGAFLWRRSGGELNDLGGLRDE
ncbi:hypothetical protein HKK80_02340 [Halonotius sp. F2-221B]|uniref:COG1361 S-layer family protein n=1 Tax=Halonotius sp. F2-221B TaxID=2731620 RepID=UPI00398B0493